MPRHVAQGTDAATLVALLDQIETAGERPVAMVVAGDSWVVVSEKKPGRPPKTVESRS